MKRIVQSAMLIAVFSGIAAADDGLDAALAKLKEKAHRQNYSTSADLHRQQMALVPEEQSDEEKALDAKLRQMEKELDRSSSITARGFSGPRIVRSASQSQDDKNWLTPALLDNIVSKDITDDAEGSDWVTDELERQKNIRLEQELLKEAAAEKQPFSNRLQSEQDSSLSELKSYNKSLQDILSSQKSSSDSRAADSQPGMFFSKERSVSPFSLSSRQEKEQESTSSGIFSSRRPTQSMFETKRYSPTQTTPSSFAPTTYGNSQKEPSTLRSFSPSWKTEESQPLKPIEKIRKASPVHKKDPFSNDFMPTVKKSLWE